MREGPQPLRPSLSTRCVHALTPQAYKSKNYMLEYYKNGSRTGIKERGSAKYKFGFGGTNCCFNETQLRAIGAQTIRKLDEGMREDAAKAWAIQKVKK